MKTLKLYIIAILTFLLFFSGCIVTIIGDVNPTTPDSPSVVKLVSVAVLAVYEVVVRLVPSVGDYSVVSWIIKALKKVSDTLNRKIEN
jgi:uncharacterized membrane protein